MRVALVTTFFGPHRFGGDAAYVERLSEALLRRGHSVDVFYTPSAFDAVRRGSRPLMYTAPAELRIHGLVQRTPRADLLWMHQTGGLGRHGTQLLRQLEEGAFDVIHFHNISLVGGPSLLAQSPASAVRLMTAHEHWLTCPLSLLWRYGREACERATCTRCAIRAGRPPQLWRHSGAIARGVAALDALVFPSRHTLSSHAQRGIHHRRARVLPYFLTDDWMPSSAPPAPPAGAPFRFVGRLVPEKGLQTILPLFRERPHCTIEIVGDGPFRAELERMASGSPNIRFVGSVSAREVRALLPNTRALIVPSLFPETFGYVLIEAWSQGIPTLASCAGALPEVSSAGGGWTCASTQDFALWIDRLHGQPHLARERGLEGWTQARQRFSEVPHVRAWESLVTDCQDRGEPRSGIDADATAGPSKPHERTP